MSKELFELIAKVKKTDFYIPREYKTIGGMWTVDTWSRDGVTVKVMDEGYTTVVRADGLEVISGYNGKEYVKYKMGDEETLKAVLGKLNEEKIS